MPNRNRINAGRINAASLAEPFVNPIALFPHARWAQAQRAGLVAVFSAANLQPHERAQPAGWAQGDPAEQPRPVAWGNLQPHEITRGNGWQDADPHDLPSVVPWRELDIVEIARAGTHRDSVPLEQTAALWWRSPPIMDVLNRMPRGRLAVRDELYRVGYPHGEIRHPSNWAIRWGQGRPPPTLVPNPEIFEPVPGPPDPDPIYTPPPGDAVALPFQCDAFDGPGDQVPLPFRRFECLRRSYVVANTVTCTRVDTGATVECLEFSINGDIESYTDGFSGRLPHTAADMVIDGPVEVMLNVNGQTFLMLIESRSQNSAFDRSTGRTDTISIRGRSISAELDEPFAAPRNHFESETRTALQLMQNELPIDGSWTLSADPAFVDWTIPGGTFSYTGLSPIRAIARVAASVGAVAQQVPGARELRVVPRYPVDPWKQQTTQAAVEIEYSQVRGASTDFAPTALANGIYVAGETTDGHLVKGQRTGTAGAPWLETVTDALITDPQAGLQRARAELGATGKRDIYQLEIPLDLTGSGLVTAGTLVNVIENVATDWNAQAAAWSLTGRVSNDSGLEIWQTVTVERYRDQ